MFAGIEELRESICKFHKHYDNLSYTPDQVINAPGSKELILLLLNVFNGGKQGGGGFLKVFCFHMPISLFWYFYKLW